jgi:hypothetical protein
LQLPSPCQHPFIHSQMVQWCVQFGKFIWQHLQDTFRFVRVQRNEIDANYCHWNARGLKLPQINCSALFWEKHGLPKKFRVLVLDYSCDQC